MSSDNSKPNTSQALTDVQLLERLFLKLALIQADDDLQRFLVRYLSHILLMFNSADEQLHAKLIDLLTHLNKRLIERPNIALPLTQLFDRLQQEKNSQRVVNFSMIYVRMGLSRCGEAEKGQLFPVITESLKGKSTTTQKDLVQLLIPMLPFVKCEGVSNAGYSLLPFTWNQFEDVKPLITEYLYYYLLLPYNIGKFENSIPPGYSQKGIEALKANNNNLPIEDGLEKVKLSILEFLTTEHFKSPQDCFILLVVASGDPRVRVKEKAESILKKIPLPDCTGSLDIVKCLFSLFLGGSMYSVHSRPKGPKRAKVTPADEEAKPVDYLIRLKIFPFLIKSDIAHDIFPDCIKIIFESLFGSATNARLMEYSLQFAYQLCVKTTDKKIGFMAPLLENALEKLLTQSTNVNLKVSGYRTLGLLAKRRPQAFKDKLQFFQSMFESLMVADQDLGLSIYECISLMTDAFKSDNEDVQKILENQFPIYLEEESSLVRLATIRCCHRIFAPTHALSRYLMLIGAGDTRGDVRDEADRGLSLEGKKKDELPNFNELVLLLVAKGKQSSTKYVSTVGELPFKPIVLVKILEYLEQLIFKLSGADRELIPLEHLQQRKVFFKQLSENKNIISHYLKLIMYGLKPAAYPALNVVSLRSLKSVLRCIPDFKQDITYKTVEPFVSSGRRDTRQLAAEVTGLLMRENIPQQMTEVIISLLLKTDENARMESFDGSLLALGYVLGHAKHETLALIETDCVTKSLNAITVSVNHDSYFIIRSAYESLSIILAHHPDSEILKLNLEEIFGAVSEKVNSSKSDISCKESGFQLLGILAVCCRREEFLKKVCDCLLKQHTLQGSDLHLGIAESLSMCVVGNRSKAFGSLPFLHDLTLDKQTPATLDDSILKYILESIFQTLTDDRVVKRNYSVPLWLISLLQLVIVPFQLYIELEQIHTSFLLILLNSSNSLSQESASVGLYIVFTISNSATRPKLYATLQKYMGTQSIDYVKRSKKKKDEESSPQDKEDTDEEKEERETTLERALSKTASTTYKEIFNLSRVMKDPAFTYPLLNLGHLFTICTLHKGKTLKLDDTKEQCISQLEPNLVELIPKIYSFLHDPHPDLQKTMQNIWSNLVNEDKKVVEKHFRSILTELKALLGYNSWSVRQGCCLCLRDILTSQPYEAFAEELPELWKLILRNLDDFKESVRVAATLVCVSLSKITVKICNSSNDKELAEKNIVILLPLVLDYVVNSPVKDVQSICLSTLVSITKYAGQLIKPVIPQLIPALLNALSDLEPSVLNKVSVSVDQDQISQEKVESVRLSLSRSSPMMDTIKSCIEYIDADVLEQLMPRLIDLIKSSIALNTKVGCSKLAMYLVAHSKHEMLPFTHKLINAFIARINDKSLSVKKTYASSISQLAKVAKESTVEKLITKINAFYFSGDTDQELNACLILQALSRDCTELTNNFKSDLLPLVYFALHDKVTTKDETQVEDSAKYVNNALWEEIWDSLAPYKERSLVLYLDEVMTILQQNLEAAVWEKREQSLKALINLAEKIPEEFSINQIDPILAALMKSLPGRVWEGKVHLPRAIELLTVKCSEKIKTHGFVQAPPIPDLIKTLLREASRSNELQQRLIQALGGIIEEYKSDKYPEFFKLSYSLLDKQKETEADEDNIKAKQQHELTIAIFSAFAKVFPNFNQKGFLQDFFTSAALLINLSSRKVHLAVLESLGNVCDKIETEENPELVVESISLVLKPVIISTGNQNYSAIRGESLKVLLKLLNLLEKIKFIEKVLTRELKQLLTQQVQVSSDHQSLVGRVMFYFDEVVKETDGDEDMES